MEPFKYNHLNSLSMPSLEQGISSGDTFMRNIHSSLSERGEATEAIQDNSRSNDF